MLSLLLSKLLDHLASLSEVVSREAREQVMRYLEMKPAVYKFNRFVAYNVRGRPQLSMGEMTP